MLFPAADMARFLGKGALYPVHVMRGPVPHAARYPVLPLIPHLVPAVGVGCWKGAPPNVGGLAPNMPGPRLWRPGQAILCDSGRDVIVRLYASKLVYSTVRGTLCYSTVHCTEYIVCVSTMYSSRYRTAHHHPSVFRPALESPPIPVSGHPNQAAVLDSRAVLRKVPPVYVLCALCCVVGTQYRVVTAPRFVSPNGGTLGSARAYHAANLFRAAGGLIAWK